MNKTLTLRPAALAAHLLAAPLLAAHATAADLQSLGEVVVTATPMQTPLVVETDPSIPRQPLPAHDGADYLKTIPGFAVMRKGGTDGEPVFRGMAGSRLNVMTDDMGMAGACPAHMDTATAYIYPEAYDRLTVIKGPQTVLYANQGSAATIKFDREPPSFTQPGASFSGSVLGASFGRHEEMLKASAGTPLAYVEASATNAQSDDYRDGSGTRVHSRYHRWSTGATLGLTPERDTRIELSAARSDGQAAYADRSMDGVKFLRESVALKFEKKNLSPLLEKLELQAGHYTVDHVMDNFTLRAPPMMPMAATLGLGSTQARAAGTLRLDHDLSAVVGSSYAQSTHSKASAGSMVDDAAFRSAGVFGELTKLLSPSLKAVAGLRADSWEARDKRSVSSTAGQQRNETTWAGFARLEHAFGAATTGYAGFGHAERFPDYWELIAMSSSNATVATASAFQSVRKEKTDQLDAGLLYKAGNLDLNASAFYNRIDDVILINYNGLATGVSGIATNTDAQTHGVELGADLKTGGASRLGATLSWVHGRDLGNGKPLAQIPPLEGRLSYAYDDGKWSAGGVLRMVAAQDRFNTGYGSIAGKDLGAATGFFTVSLNAGFRPTRRSLVVAGIDNLFDRNYAEFISRSGLNASGMSVVGGYVPLFRVNEPGRTVWVRASLAFD